MAVLAKMDQVLPPSLHKPVCLSSSPVIFFISFLMFLASPRALNFKVAVLHSSHLGSSEVKPKAAKTQNAHVKILAVESQDFPDILNVWAWEQATRLVFLSIFVSST